YSVTVPGDLAPGLHWAQLAATAPSGEVVTDSVRVYVRPAGWIRPPATFARRADGTIPVVVEVASRMGGDVRGAHLPLVAVVGDAVAPLAEDDSAGTYTGSVRAGAAASRVILASLVGDLQRRVVEIASPVGVRAGAAPGAPVSAHAAAGQGGAAAPSLPTYAAAIRFEHPPAVDGDLADWPATAAQPVVIGPGSFLLTDSSVYHGAQDLSARLRFGWDDSTLYAAGEITDDSVTTGDAWDIDRVNFVFDMKHDTSPLTYASANPPLNEWQEDDYWVFFRYGQAVIRRFGKVNADPIPGARLATRRTATGWAYEAAIPRAALPGYVPFVGQVAGLQVFVTDGDGDRTATELMWSAKWPYTADGIEWRLAELATLLFVDAPSP
ncbi:MAG: sugar-binding protein, partial [Gemmatimonadales bacterium]